MLTKLYVEQVPLFSSESEFEGCFWYVHHSGSAHTNPRGETFFTSRLGVWLEPGGSLAGCGRAGQSSPGRRSNCFVKVARAPTDGNHARFGGLESVEQARPRAGRWMEARLPVVDRGRRTSGREPQRADSTRETKRKTVATLGGNGGIRGGALPRLIVKIFRCCRHEYPLYYSGKWY